MADIRAIFPIENERVSIQHIEVCGDQKHMIRVVYFDEGRIVDIKEGEVYLSELVSVADRRAWIIENIAQPELRTMTVDDFIGPPASAGPLL